MSSRRLALPVLACAVLVAGFTTCPLRPQEPVRLPALPAFEGALSFEGEVRPVLEGRCVVCHGCYDAPCQLLLSSSEGAERGANKKPVYDSSRLLAMAPTRMFIDATNTQQWREKGFFPVLGAPGTGREALMLRMLALGRAHPVAPGERLPADFPLDINRKLSCPASEAEFDSYAREHPQGGMPYAVAPLAEGELRVLASWAARGAAPPPQPAPPPAVEKQVQQWERFLNGSSAKERLVARYLYEHWFLAHLVFEDEPAGPFFRVVRSRTGPGEPVDEIASVRPYDDPGQGRFWYRLRPIRASIVHKTHILYRLGPAKLRRLRSLFLETDWEPAWMPGYAPEEAANPFLTFDQIPARSRYQYLLDDAEYFVMTFIRGPVCRGQVAVDVIEDHFFVTFLDPDHDLSVIDPAFLEKTKRLLSLPAAHRDDLLPGELFLDYANKQRKYLDARHAFYDAIDPERRGPALDWIWDGDGRDPNALLTVFRNFDNATVRKGFLGAMPKTAWVLDYPLFERIYYDLVAGFDVFGNVTHQVATRLYMDHLRMQAENLFLSFLPADRREAIRASWYVGAKRQVDYFLADRLHALGHGTQIRFHTDHPVPELLEMVLGRSSAVAGPPDLLNRCPGGPCNRPGASATEQEVERELRRLAPARGGFVALLPEVTVLRVRVGGDPRDDLLYTLVHNRAHTNVAFMFREDDRLVPADDTLTLVRGHFGSYPNFALEAHATSLAGFVDGLRAVGSAQDLEAFVDHYGVRRSDPRFWDLVDWLTAHFRRRHPVEAGIYDFGRYENL